MSSGRGNFERLIKVIEDLAAGDLTARYEISREHDDVDAIGFGVNILVEELTANITRLEHEIAERRSAESELAEAERRQSQARQELQTLRTARLASLGVLAAGVGHEINNPLTYVLGNLSYLQRKLDKLLPASAGDEADEVSSVLEETREGADRIRRIVQDLKLFSRVEDDQPNERVNVVDVVESALGLVNNEIRHRAQLVRDFEEVPWLPVSEPRLAQVLVNLLVNAAHSLPAGDARDNEIRVSIRRRDQQVAIEVADTGAGISADDLPRVFDPFYSTKPTGEGTGLGLSICRELVAKMEGQIEVDSVLGGGTTVRVVLPIGEVEPSRVAAEEPEESLLERVSLRVLIIDDEVPVARSLARLLRGSDVTIASGGREALSVLGRRSDFDLIFCDLMMPNMSGMEVFEQIRTSQPEVAERFAFVTGGVFTEAARAFVAGIPNPCIQKPFNQRELERLLSDAPRGENA